MDKKKEFRRLIAIIGVLIVIAAGGISYFVRDIDNIQENRFILPD